MFLEPGVVVRIYIRTQMNFKNFPPAFITLVPEVKHVALLEVFRRIPFMRVHRLCVYGVLIIYPIMVNYSLLWSIIYCAGS